MSSESIPAQVFDCKLYPNPAGAYFQIEAASFNNSLYVRLYNLEGMLMSHEEVIPNQRIDLQNYPEGIYCVVISDGPDQVVIKLLIQRQVN